MAKKYKVKKEYEGSVVATRNPSTYERQEKGRFVLANCTQKDLKYLYDVIKYQGVEEANNVEQENTPEQ